MLMRSTRRKPSPVAARQGSWNWLPQFNANSGHSSVNYRGASPASQAAPTQATGSPKQGGKEQRSVSGGPPADVPAPGKLKPVAANASSLAEMKMLELSTKSNTPSIATSQFINAYWSQRDQKRDHWTSWPSTIGRPPNRIRYQSDVCRLEAPSGFEPEMEVLQTSALPLGDGAVRNDAGL